MEPLLGRLVPIKRWFACANASLLAFAAACSGPTTGTGFVPNLQSAPDMAEGGPVPVALTLHIPRRHRGIHHPATIDAATKSVVVVVNHGRLQVFNTTSSSPGCSSSSSGVTCSFSISARPGVDTIAASTFDALNGVGTLLDYGEIRVLITRGKSNKISMKLGHVLKVFNTNDSGPGSLREAVADAKAGEVIGFSINSYPATIGLTTGAISIGKNVTIAGPGSSKLTVTSGGTSQLFTVSSGVTATVSQLTLSAGNNSGTTPTGGAINNAGTLTLNAVSLTSSRAVSSSRKSYAPRRERRVRFDPRPRSRGIRPPRHPHSAAPPRPHSVSTASGGAIYNSGYLLVEYSTLYGNSVDQGNGGAIYNAGGATLLATNSTFSNNSGAIGGAIDNEGTATLNTDTFSGNYGWSGTGTPLTGGWGYGAAVYSDGQLTVIGSSFSDNIAGGASQQSTGVGGAIAQYAGSLSISGSSFASNSAGGGTNGSYGYGGAIFYGGNNLSVSSTTFTQNAAGGDAFGYGGAIFSSSGISSSANTFSHNAAAGSSGGGYAYGGAIYTDGSASLTNDTYNGNSASGTGSGYGYAGAVDSESGSTIKNTTFTNNSVSAGSNGTGIGGAVFVDGNSNVWTNTTFTGNTASAGTGSSYASGGAAAVYAQTSITGSTFSTNAVTVTSGSPIGAVGGALAVEQGPFSLTGTLSSNSAETQGGALWIDDTASITDSTITANSVTAIANPNDGGGGIYNALGGTLTVTGSTINGNSVAGHSGSAGGGGMFNAGTLTMSNSTVTGNTSSVDGGGLENDATTGVQITNVTIYNNSTNGSGGSLKNLYSTASMSIGSSIVAGGTASSSSSNGNDVSNDGTITSNDYNIIQTATVGTPISGQTGNNLQVNPQLSSLQNNGGPTKTNADSNSSPGTAYIPNSVCKAAGISTDQRGQPRNGQGGGFCDVGAYELQ